ncbi:GH39 family glycosyl hydrolase [Mucisphaera calidilacus]|uniref:Beta-xylosidase n=1 Tax=Mucisphaera calidilacus TaxID=2527982 RepID=A0A518BWS7_9BACT|nr:glycosyl hydrolase [Mucisphaera calidilacus]QDU71426.1 Beta-xylosidase [Mucisphaera calidilacus]
MATPDSARSLSALTLLIVSLFCGCAAAEQQASHQPSRVVVDFNNTTGHINRAIWGVEGMPKVFMLGQQNPGVLTALYRLNPTGWHARMETWIGFLEPENDNDDPNVFDWDRLHPDKMIRFIDDRKAYEKWIASLNVELMPLLCYNTEWLESDDENDKISDKNEWAEFAAAALHSWNADGDDLRARYAEIWNEPNMPMFGMGNQEAFYELYNTAAERLHRDDPALMVGGPALTPAYWARTDEWFKGFVENCGHNADFVIHHIYHGTDKGVDYEVNKIIEMTDLFRTVPGKATGQMALTEIDSWHMGWGKFQYMMQRHMGYHDIRDRLLSVHHFTTLAYNEHGNHVFGIMTNHGAPMLGTYWSFWIMRNLDGDAVNVMQRGPAQVLDVIGSKDTNHDGSQRLAMVAYNRTGERLNVPVTLQFPPADHDRVLRVDVVEHNFQDVEDVKRIPAGAGTFEFSLSINTGVAVAATILEPGRRHVPIFDLNDQEGAAVSLATDAREIKLGDWVALRARITNTTGKNLSGKLSLQGVPRGWRYEIADQHVHLQDLGDTVTIPVMISVDSEPPLVPRMTMGATSSLLHLNNAVAPVLVFDPDDGSEERISLPVDLAYIEPQDVKILR